jgi:hypothetical protein
VGVAARLPEAYKKFWYEWKKQKPTPVHYIPEPGKWKRNPETEEVYVACNSLPVKELTMINIFKIIITQDVTPCSLLKRYQCFRGTCFLHLQGSLLSRWKQ